MREALRWWSTSADKRRQSTGSLPAPGGDKVCFFLHTHHSRYQKAYLGTTTYLFLLVSSVALVQDGQRCVLRLAESNVDDETLHGVVNLINGQLEDEIEW